jgi:hypothetical protein
MSEIEVAKGCVCVWGGGVAQYFLSLSLAGALSRMGWGNGADRCCPTFLSRICPKKMFCVRMSVWGSGRAGGRAGGRRAGGRTGDSMSEA